MDITQDPITANLTVVVGITPEAIGNIITAVDGPLADVAAVDGLEDAEAGQAIIGVLLFGLTDDIGAAVGARFAEYGIDVSAIDGISVHVTSALGNGLNVISGP